MHSGNAVKITLSEAQGVGRLWLFARFDGLPQLDRFLYADLSHDSTHQVTVFCFILFFCCKPFFLQVLIRSGDVTDNTVLFVGVYGSPLMPPGSSSPYSLSVSTGCQTYTECGLCVSDPDCGWCLPNPFNSSFGTYIYFYFSFLLLFFQGGVLRATLRPLILDSCAAHGHSLPATRRLKERLCSIWEFWSVRKKLEEEIIFW